MCKCGCVDTTFFIIVSCAFLAVVGCLIYTWVVGDSRLILYNVDSQGNLCGFRSNDLDLSDRPLLFLFDSFYFPHLAYSICTDLCPQYDITTKLAMYSYANTTQHRLCSYDLPVADYVYAKYDSTSKCPKLPVLKSVDFLQICIPEVAINSYQSLGFVDLVVPLLDQSFRSIYNYWAFDALGVVAAFFLSSLLFIMLRCLSKCVLAAILPILILATGCGIGALWFGYHIVCKRLSTATQSKLPLTSFEVYNEIALFVFAIVLTAIPVILGIVILINIRSFPHEIDRLFKVFAKFMDSTKYIIWLPAISCIVTGAVLTGATAAAFCALGLVHIKPPGTIVSSEFTKLPGPPYVVRPERAAVGFAIVLALFWLPRIVVTAVKLAVHISASQYIQMALMDFKPKEFGVKPSWFSLLCTTINISLAECITLPISFLSGLILIVISPFQSGSDCFSSFLRAVTFWIPAGYAVQASVSESDRDSDKLFYCAIDEGVRVINDSVAKNGSKKVCTALLAGEWMMSCVVTATFSLPICVVLLQMRYESLISLSTPSIFLVAFFGYWIATSSLAPFSAAFTTFCLNYESVSKILSENDKVDSATYRQTSTAFTNKDLEAVKQNEINLQRLEKH